MCCKMCIVLWNMLLLALVLSISAPVKAISDGHDTDIKRHKEILSLQYQNEHFCGATLIAPNWALTSASCINLHSTDLTVRAGSTSRSSGGEVLEVATTVVHPNYNAITHDSDIALIKFTEDANENLTFPRSLPFKVEDIKEYSPINMLGWGLTTREGSYPDTLQMAQVSSMSRETCQSVYPSTVINLNMFCGGWIGGSQNVSACDGDYGGPGVVYSRVEGIISWGKGCGTNKYPTVFTRVANYVDWIHGVTNMTSMIAPCW